MKLHPSTEIPIEPNPCTLPGSSRAYFEQLKQTYRVVKTLSEKNGAAVLQLRHRALQKDLILRRYEKPVPAYDLLCELRHPNLPEVYDSLHFADGQLVFEESIEGVTVAQVLETGRYTPRGAADIVRKTCAAVAALHRCGILHLDIKPQNVMVTSRGEVKLIDLNASKLTASEPRQETEVLGTIGYAAYEQFGLSACDERTDVFALGVLLNVLLTGEHPTKKQASGHLGRIVCKCTQTDPTARYQNAEKLMLAL